MPKIDIKEAVIAVHDYVQDIEDLMGVCPDSMRLEEVELADQENEWLITLGFDMPVKTNESLAASLAPSYKREYKVFKVDAETGAVKSMKIRTLQ